MRFSLAAVSRRWLRRFALIAGSPICPNLVANTISCRDGGSDRGDVYGRISITACDLYGTCHRFHQGSEMRSTHQFNIREIMISAAPAPRSESFSYSELSNGIRRSEIT